VLRHYLAHACRNWVGFKDVLDSCLAIGRIGACDGAGWPERSLAGGRPEREVSHARQELVANARLCSQTVSGDIEEGRQDLGPRALESGPELNL
jgi:hypothetical protein